MSMTGGSYHSYAIEPAHPNGIEEVRARIDSPDGCLNGFASTQTDIAARTLTLTLSVNDFVEPQCADPTPIHRSFGVLPPGAYTFTFKVCGGNVQPESPPCTTVETRELVVGGGEPTSVPTLTGVGVVALLAVIAIAPWRRFA